MNFSCFLRLPYASSNVGSHFVTSLLQTPRNPSIFVPLSTAYLCTSKMTWSQTTFTLPLKSRGTYLITDVVEKEVSQISEYKVGLLNLFLQHTSCALGLNEDVDENVRSDMSDALDRIAPEDKIGGMYRHAEEGPDDMPVSFLSLFSTFADGGTRQSLIRYFEIGSH